MKLLIFDVDGTLVDSQAHIVAAMDHAFGVENLTPPDRADILAIIGLSLPQAMVRLAPEADTQTRARLVEGYKNSFATLRRSGADTLSPLYPGARGALRRLAEHEDILLAVATGKSRRGMAHVVEMHGLEGVFQSVQTADDHPSKPHPSMIETCLNDTGVTREDTVMLGDTVFDMEMARAAGVAALGVGWGYHPAQALGHAGALDVLGDFGALMPWLGTHWGRA